LVKVLPLTASVCDAVLFASIRIPSSPSVVLVLP
jgi:hypothetical protein